MEQRENGSLYMETALPQPGRLTSRGALLFVLLAAVALLSALRRSFGQLLPFSPLWIQAPLYVLLLLWTAWYARRRLTAYRYTLTDETLSVERLAAGRARMLVCVPCADILREGTKNGHTICAFTGKRRDAGTLYLQSGGHAVRLLNSMSEQMRERVLAASFDV